MKGVTEGYLEDLPDGRCRYVVRSDGVESRSRMFQSRAAAFEFLTSSEPFEKRGRPALSIIKGGE